MARNDSQDRPRPLLLGIFVAVFGLLLYRLIRLWAEIDAGEKWARAAELLLIAVGAWVVVWPESFPPWRSSKGSRGPKHRPEESCAEPGAAADR
jgi:H+/Cl- antiporter ClcA